jgi:hypothetical protein
MEIALKDVIYYSPTLMFRNDLTPKENSFIGIRHGADLAFYKEIMIIAGSIAKIQYLNEIVYKYQKHNTNITVTQNTYRKEHIYAIKILQKKYPKYSHLLASSICDFCCVALFKNIATFRFSDVYFFWWNGLKAGSFNPYKCYRALKWGINFYRRKLFVK